MKCFMPDFLIMHAMQLIDDFFGWSFHHLFDKAMREHILSFSDVHQVDIHLIFSLTPINTS